jgi:hypothetical protein
MSVDDRLREAFAETDRAWDQLAPAALTRLQNRHRRDAVVRRAAVAATAAAAAVAATVVVTTQGKDDAPQPAPPGPTSTPSPMPDASALDGTWRSAPLTKGDVRRAARDAGHPGATAAMLGALPSTPFRLVLVVDLDRNSTLLKLRTGGREQTSDQENIEVSGDQVVLRPRFAEGENVHRWTVEDGVLRLSFVSTTERPSEGAPSEAWQRLLYDTAAFTR